jgi:hypothetical protein
MKLFITLIASLFVVTAAQAKAPAKDAAKKVRTPSSVTKVTGEDAKALFTSLNKATGENADSSGNALWVEGKVSCMASGPADSMTFSCEVGPLR